MSVTLFFATLLLGIIVGWQGCLAAKAFVSQRRGSSGPAVVAATVGQTTGGPAGLELDLRDTHLYDWRRTDPDIAACPACRGRGRLWLFDQGAGRATHCPCGTPASSSHERTTASPWRSAVP